MKNYKLNNLRELSTEEQMRLNGGNDSTACSCSCSCSCEKEGSDSNVKDAKNEVTQKVKNDGPY